MNSADCEPGSRLDGAHDDDVYRLLLVDDNAAIHQDIRKIMNPAVAAEELDALEDSLFGAAAPAPRLARFEIDSAYQGREALAKVQSAVDQGRPYAVAVIDVQMPPGWDGVETCRRIWQVLPELQVIICSAYSSYSWSDMIAQLGLSDRLLILKKPFETIELTQMIHALARKWTLQGAVEQRLRDLDQQVELRTRSLLESNRKLTEEMTRREQTEVRLRRAQKLEAVGQLAAGIAHEINTPVQYVGDSLYFLERAFADTQRLLDELRRTYPAVADGAGVARMREAERVAGLDYLRANVPAAFAATREGLQRIATIVKATHEFSHTGGEGKRAADVNRALRATLEIARSEYKHVAELNTDFGELPPLVCRIEDLNQVFLNLIVNAAHAAAEAPPGRAARIDVTTRARAERVVVSVRDSGGGIPEALRERVFEPFFTTKPVGKGSGQGLAIAHTIVVGGHGGDIDIDCPPGGGTVVTVSLPVRPEEAA